MFEYVMFKTHPERCDFSINHSKYIFCPQTIGFKGVRLYSDQIKRPEDFFSILEQHRYFLTFSLCYQ